MDKLQINLLEEDELTDHNYDLMRSALEYRNTYLIDKNGKLFLTINPLITLNNNIITDSVDKSLTEPALYQLVDKFNERKVTHNQFCNIFF